VEPEAVYGLDPACRMAHFERIAARSAMAGSAAGSDRVFQSWDDEMQEHYQLHFIVTAEGLGPDGSWKEMKNICS